MWESQRRPICLLNAIKYNPDNMKLINFVIDKLEATNKGFVCDDVMKQAIRHDLVDVVKRLIDNRWHIITENDELHAQLIDGECHRFFMERSNNFFLSPFCGITTLISGSSNKKFEIIVAL